jgi:hypothetical protein
MYSHRSASQRKGRQVVEFRKSSFCHTGGCVEVGAEFVKSSFSGAECCVEVGAGFVKAKASNPKGSCVEVAAEAKAESSCGPEEIVVRVRDTKRYNKETGEYEGPENVFTMDEWDAFLKGMDAGPNCEFRVVPPGGGEPVTVGKSVGVACP